MSDKIIVTTEVNPFDLYIRNKIGMKVLLYKIICGAVVTLIALRLNEALKEYTQGVSARAAEYVGTDVWVRITVELVTSLALAILFAFTTRVAMGERDMNEIFNVLSARG